MDFQKDPRKRLHNSNSKEGESQEKKMATCTGLCGDPRIPNFLPTFGQSHVLRQVSHILDSLMFYVRVTHKSPLFSGKAPNSRSLNLDIIDRDGREMKVVVFGELAIKYNKLFEKDLCYSIKNVAFRGKNPFYNKFHGDYEMEILPKSKVKPIDDLPDIPKSPPKLETLCTIQELQKKNLNTYVDVVAYVKLVHPVKTVTLSKGDNPKSESMRDVLLSDQSEYEITLTLWFDRAISCDYTPKDVLLIRGAKLTYFNYQRTLSTSTQTTITVNDTNIKEVRDLTNHVKEIVIN